VLGLPSLPDAQVSNSDRHKGPPEEATIICTHHRLTSLPDAPSLPGKPFLPGAPCLSGERKEILIKDSRYVGDKNLNAIELNPPPRVKSATTHQRSWFSWVAFSSFSSWETLEVSEQRCHLLTSECSFLLVFHSSNVSLVPSG